MKIRKHSNVFISSILSLVLFARVGGAITNQVSTTAVQLHSNYGELDFNIRLSEIEAKSRHQESEISLLKTLRLEDKKVINQLRDRVDQLEASVPKKEPKFNDENEKILKRQKRPFRLAPTNFNRGEENKIDKEQNLDKKFYGPATSCEELGMLGYTLNGFYMVQRKSQSTSGSKNKIEVVFCQFCQPSKFGAKEATENRLGFLTIVDKSSVNGGIYFYVQRYGNLPISPNGVIRFNKERLNIGRAMDISTGVFTAPKSGIYHFSVTIMKEGYSLDAMWIYFRVNGNKIGLSAVGTTVTGASASFQPTLKLKKGDRVDLWKDNSYGTVEYRSDELMHHFSGWLLQEEDII